MNPTLELRWRKVTPWEKSHSVVDGQHLVLQQKWEIEDEDCFDLDGNREYAPCEYEWRDAPLETK